MEDLPEALLGEIIKRLTWTGDLNSLSLVSKRLYTIEAELRDSIYVGCGAFPVTQALASLCSRFPNLCKVEFNHSGWTDNNGMQLDNYGLQLLSSGCPSLTDLSLNFCSCIDDSGLGFLARFKKLVSLRLNTLPAITSSGLFLVAVGCTSLSSLHLICCKKVGVKEIICCGKVGGMEFNYREEVGAMEWLYKLGRVGSLTDLVVENCKRIRQLDLLMFGPGWMKLQNFEFQSYGLPLAHGPLDPSNRAQNQHKYEFSSDCLKDLTLARTSTEPELGLCCLPTKCEALENLCLYYVLGVTDNDMVTLAHNNRNLRSISLMMHPQHCEGYVYRTSLTDDTLKALALCCPMLQSFKLSFYGCEPDWPEIGFTQEGLVMLIHSCPIRDLSLGGAHIFDDEGMKALSRARFLESLKLVRCIAITDAGLRPLACSPCLINLTLELCDDLTDDGLSEFVHAGSRGLLNQFTTQMIALVSRIG